MQDFMLLYKWLNRCKVAAEQRSVANKKILFMAVWTGLCKDCKPVQ